MRQSLDPPHITPAIPERLLLPRPVSAGTSPFTSTVRRDRPSTAPTSQTPPSPNQVDFPPTNHEIKKSRNRSKSPSGRQSPEHHPNASTEASNKVAEKILTLIKILKFCQNSKRYVLYLKAEACGRQKFARKLQRWYRDAMHRRHEWNLAAMPAVFMRFLKKYQKKLAVKRITTFLREYTSIHSHSIIKSFLKCVRKAQVYIRETIRVKRARVLLLTLYWDRCERAYRKGIEDQDRETNARSQRERLARINMTLASPSGPGDVHGRWGMTHKQVVSLLHHMDSVDGQRAHLLRETGARNRPGSNRTASPSLVASPSLSQIQFQPSGLSWIGPGGTQQDVVDPLLKKQIIEKYLSYKRSLHLKRDTSSLALSVVQQGLGQGHGLGLGGGIEDTATIRLVKRFLTLEEESSSIKQTTKEILERQLSGAGVPIEEEEGGGRKRKSALRIFRRRPFLCLTDPSLGKSWKHIIEEVVRDDILRKKKLLQDKNRQVIQERMTTERDKDALFHSNSGAGIGVKKKRVIPPMADQPLSLSLSSPTLSPGPPFSISPSTELSSPYTPALCLPRPLPPTGKGEAELEESTSLSITTTRRKSPMIHEVSASQPGGNNQDIPLALLRQHTHPHGQKIH